MKRLLVLSIVLLGAGCASVSELPLAPTSNPIEGGEAVDGDVRVEEQVIVESDIVFPMDENGTSGYLPIYRRFGEFFSDGRFYGYHTGEDAEVTPEDGPDGEMAYPIRAVADGTIAFLSSVDGYGGVIVLQHDFEGEKIQTLYGHLDIGSSTLRTGDPVAKGQFLANLGADKSDETDGERQHLHFAVYAGTEIKLAGYADTPSALDAWINPQDFFAAHDALNPLLFDRAWQSSYDLWYPEDPRRDIPQFRTAYGDLAFSLPIDWDVEYIPSLDALNLYRVTGEGSARERSQIFIRYFDANDFLTLSTVDIIEQYDLTVGVEDYLARRYVIEKKTGVADFADQPNWRNDRHTVTDFRAEQGFTRYFVVAANPALDASLYEQVLESMEILK